MPARLKRDKRRRAAHITPEAVRLFRQSQAAHDPYDLRDLKISLAAALGRSKFSASPLDREPRSLIGCDTEPADVALGLRGQMLKRTRRSAASH